ncbi:MAG: threonine/serine exporter family protein [Firmicutes bacterium]|nr:threonine/serine exporter family protein [Bacillota bacterium]
MTDEEKNDSFLLHTAELAGITILENGGETFRAEETVLRMCRAGGAEPSVIAFPTGFFISMNRDGGTPLTSVSRIRLRSVNLYRLERANSYSRAFCRGDITLEETERLLRNLNEPGKKQHFRFAIAAGLSAAMFTMLFGGSVFDFIVSFFCSAFIQFVTGFFRHTNIHNFAVSFFGGLFITAAAIVSTVCFKTGSIDTITIGAIMPLLPGLSLTNAIRDTVVGDLVSGTARFTEAVIVAGSLAAGVAVGLSVYINLGGVL